MGALRVLVVDDEPSILKSTALLLGVLGFHVTTLSDAALVIPEARRVLPDVLLQDVRMPGLDLERLVAEIRADAALARLPIVLFTASMDVREVAERVGAAAFLEKPFTLDELRAALRVTA